MVKAKTSLDALISCERPEKAEACPLPPFGHLPPLPRGKEEATRYKLKFCNSENAEANTLQFGILPLQIGGRWRQPEGGASPKYDQSNSYTRATIESLTAPNDK
jgi:hypothetical protein